MLIRVRNLLDSQSPKSFLSNGEAVGASTIKVQNVNAFQANWAVQIGKTGEEKSEIVLVGTATPSGTSLTITGTTRFDHPSDTPIYAIKFDQLIFKSSTSGTSGTATALTDGTISITPDSKFTQFDDTAGATTHAYRTAFRNSVTTDESSDSDFLTPTGFSFYSLAKLRERVKRKLFSDNYIKNDEVIDDWLNEWLETMNNAAIDVDKSYGLGTTTVAFGTDGLGTVTASDYKETKRLWITYNGTDKFRAAKMDITDYTPDETFNATHPLFFDYGDNRFGVKPEQSGGTAEVVYYFIRTLLADDTDELDVSIRPYTKSFVDYCVGEAYYVDNKDSKGDRYNIRAESAKREFVDQIAQRHKVGPQSISLVEDVDGEDGLLDHLFIR